jgi:hypothetical protein
MPQDWNTLTRLTAGQPFEVERVRLVDQDIAIEGRFTPPSLAALPADDQVFVAAFVRSHGSIKQMEQLFGVSYPTVKNRLNRIAAALPFVDVEPSEPDEAESPIGSILDRLERGEVSAAQAVAEISPKRSRKESSSE